MLLIADYKMGYYVPLTTGISVFGDRNKKMFASNFTLIIIFKNVLENDLNIGYIHLEMISRKIRISSSRKKEPVKF